MRMLLARAAALGPTDCIIHSTAVARGLRHGSSDCLVLGQYNIKMDASNRDRLTARVPSVQRFFLFHIPPYTSVWPGFSYNAYIRRTLHTYIQI